MSDLYGAPGGGDEENFVDDVEDVDSVCSWMSESESIVHNWRGWKSETTDSHPESHRARSLQSLSELSAQTVAAWIPFELVETYYPPVPEDVQLRIAYWSFPSSPEDIRLYSCLANGTVEEYIKGESLLRSGAVKDSLQIGFHLSATVIHPDGSTKPPQSTSITFDRKRIVSCQCSCEESKGEWCSHIVASCLHRITKEVSLRAPVSESLSRLRRDQLQKFAQYLIAELPLQILPAAQKILDELLSCNPSNTINSVCGAPDPTAGGSTSEYSSFYLDAKNLKNNISTILIKFCVPSPIVFSDVNYLSTTPPLSAAEWTSYLRPLRGREPEGIWNLLSIVRQMYKRSDVNALPLLEILTLQCIETAQIMVWWFYTKVALNNKASNKHNGNSNSMASQNACAYLCDEIVSLWKLATLNPVISPSERSLLKSRLLLYHSSVITKIKANQNSSSTGQSHQSRSNARNKIAELENFPGFKPAIETTSLDWSHYPINGVTWGHNSKYISPFAIFKQSFSLSDTSQVNSSQAVIQCEYPSIRNGMVVRENNNNNESDEGVEMNANANANNGNGLPNGPSSSNGGRSLHGDEVDSDSSAIVDPHPPEAVSVGGGSSSEPLDGVATMDDQQYRVYFYDSGANFNTRSNNEKDKELIDVYKNLRSSIEDPWEVLFLRTEGLYAHGYIEHASTLAVRLANELLKNPLDLLAESKASAVAAATTSSSIVVSSSSVVVPPGSSTNSTTNIITSSTSSTNTNNNNKRHKRSINAASHQVTLTASNTLSHCAFLANVLLQSSSYHSLAFQIAMYGLEMPRPPASTKPMEVKLANQESELVHLLKKIPQGPWELGVIREKAHQLKEGNHKSRGDALLPLSLASFIFESLVLPQNICGSSNDSSAKKSQLLYTDEHLGFEAAVEAIGMKASVSEADHPLLCEGTRRQRGDLVLLLLLHYKNEPIKIAKIMDKLLDKEIHPLFKAPITPHLYATGGNPGGNPSNSSNLRQMNDQFSSMNLRSTNSNTPSSNNNNDWDSLIGGSGGSQASTSNNGSNSNPRICPPSRNASDRRRGGGGGADPGSDSGSSGNSSAESVDSSSSSSAVTAASAASLPPPAPSGLVSCGGSFRAPLASSELGAGASCSSSSSWNANKKGSMVMSSNSSGVVQYASGGGNHSLVRPLPSSNNPNPKLNRFRPGAGGKRNYPILPNQPSDSLAHFMYELAKTILTKAGGSSSSSLFNQQTAASSNTSGPHRALLMVAFQIGLYSLGLYNAVTSNWLSRTYSSQVHWVTSQALEIGAPAIEFLISTWEGHLSPPEAASIADRVARGGASSSRESGGGGILPSVAAELALSVLPHSSALKVTEIQRSIAQCQGQSQAMLERACQAVEKAASSGGCVYPEVLFEVSRHWYSLWEKSIAAHHNQTTTTTTSSNQHNNNTNVNQVIHTISPAHHSHPIHQHPPHPVHHVMSGAHSSPEVTAYHEASLQQQQQQQQQLQLHHYPFYGLFSRFPPSHPHGHHPHGHHPHHHGAPLNPLNQQLQMVAALAGTAAPPPLQHPSLHHALHHHAQRTQQQQQVQVLSSPSFSVFPRFGGSIYQLSPIPGNSQAAAAAAIIAAGPNIAAVTLPPPAPAPAPPPHSGNNHLLNNPSVQPSSNNSVNHVNHHALNLSGQLPSSSKVVVSVPLPVVSVSSGSVSSSSSTIGNQASSSSSSSSHRLLISAYRVGMLALESLGRRASEERPEVRFAQNPTYGPDVMWLKSIAKMLGLTYFQNFLVVIGATIASPFLLQELALDGAIYLACPGTNGAVPPGSGNHVPGSSPGGVVSNPVLLGAGPPSSSPSNSSNSIGSNNANANNANANNPPPSSTTSSNPSTANNNSNGNNGNSTTSTTPLTSSIGYSTIMQSIRSNPHLTQLATKCYQMYYQCIHQRLFQLSPEDYDEFTGIILHARKAFYWTVEGPRTFQTLLQSIRRSKSCTKELWQKVLTSVQNTSIEQQL